MLDNTDYLAAQDRWEWECQRLEDKIEDMEQALDLIYDLAKHIVMKYGIDKISDEKDNDT